MKKVIFLSLLALCMASCIAISIPKVHYMAPDAMTMELTKSAYGITAIAISKDGSYVLTADNDGRTLMGIPFIESTVRLWDISSGKMVRMIKTDTMIAYLEFSPDGKHAVLTGNRLGVHRVWGIKLEWIQKNPLKLLDLTSGKL